MINDKWCVDGMDGQEMTCAVRETHAEVIHMQRNSSYMWKMAHVTRCLAELLLDNTKMQQKYQILSLINVDVNKEKFKRLSSHRTAGRLDRGMPCSAWMEKSSWPQVRGRPHHRNLIMTKHQQIKHWASVTGCCYFQEKQSIWLKRNCNTILDLCNMIAVFSQ